MSLFGKKEISEVATSISFVVFLYKSLDKFWEDVCEVLVKTNSSQSLIDEKKFDPLHNEEAKSHFALGTIVVQNQALFNLYPSKQAQRLNEYVIRSLLLRELGQIQDISLGEGKGRLSKKHISDVYEGVVVDGFVRETINEYQRILDDGNNNIGKGLDVGLPSGNIPGLFSFPFDQISGCIAGYMGFENSYKLVDDVFCVDPAIIALLSTGLVVFMGGWWKNFQEHYKIIDRKD